MNLNSEQHYLLLDVELFTQAQVWRSSSDESEAHLTVASSASAQLGTVGPPAKSPVDLDQHGSSFRSFIDPTRPSSRHIGSTGCSRQ